MIEGSTGGRSRPIAMFRNNCHFAKSEDGGKAWMVYASIVATCALNRIGRRFHLDWVFGRLAENPSRTDMHLLLSWHCHEGRYAVIHKQPEEPWEKKARKVVEDAKHEREMAALLASRRVA